MPPLKFRTDAETVDNLSDVGDEILEDGSNNHLQWTQARRVPTTDQPARNWPARRHVVEWSTLNKGTAFTTDERQRYGLEGLLPTSVESLDRQLERVMEQIASQNW